MIASIYPQPTFAYFRKCKGGERSLSNRSRTFRFVLSNGNLTFTSPMCYNHRVLKRLIVSAQRANKNDLLGKDGSCMILGTSARIE